VRNLERSVLAAAAVAWADRRAKEALFSHQKASRLATVCSSTLVELLPWRSASSDVSSLPVYKLGVDERIFATCLFYLCILCRVSAGNICPQ